MVEITLKAKFHAFIIALTPDRGAIPFINYMIQVRAALVDNVYDPEQDISVSVEEGLVKDLYVTIGSQQERLTAADNAQIKNALIQQLSISNVELLQALADITNNNAEQTEFLRQGGVDLIKSIMV